MPETTPERALRNFLQLWWWLWLGEALATIPALFNLPLPLIPGLFGFPAFMLTPLVWAAVAFSRRVPLSVFGAPLLLQLWSVLGLMPLTFLVLTGWMYPAAAAVKLGVTAFAAWRLWVLNGRRSPHRIRRQALGEGRWFSPMWSAGFTLACLVGTPVASTLYFYGNVNLALQLGTGGFARLQPRALSVAHRTYHRDGQDVHLIGMIHLGNEDFYTSVVPDIPPTDTLVLAEGVTDEEGLLTGFSYDPVAERIGLASQPAMNEMTDLPVRSADVDVSVFHESTITLLNLVSQIYSAEDPAPALLAYVRFRSDQTEEELLTELIDDLVTRRNAHLLEEIRTATDDVGHVVVPWGAIHMREVHATLESEGFVETERQWIPAIRW